MKITLARGTAGALALGLSVTACGGSRGTSVAPVGIPQVTATTASGTLSSAFAYDRAPLQNAQLLGRASFGTLTVDVVLKMQNPQGLRQYAQAVSDPASAVYRHYLTPQQIADQFGASQATQNATAAYFQGLGLSVRGWSQRMMVAVTGSQAQLETAFNTQFGLYRTASGTTVLAPMSPPRLPASVPAVGSTNIVHDTTRFHSTAATKLGGGPGLGSLSGYAPQQIAAAFDYQGAYNAGYTGRGITVGIIGTGPISTPAPGHVGDLEAFKQLYGVTGSSAITVIAATDSDLAGNAATGFTTPPPVTGSSSTCNNGSPPSGGGAPGVPPAESPTTGCNPEDGEAQLDTEQVGTLARDATVDFFLAYNPNDGCTSASNGSVIGTACPTAQPKPVASGATPQPGAGSAGGPGFPFQGLAEADEEIQSAIHQNTADVLSASFGASELGQVSAPGQSPPAEFDSNGGGLEPTEFAALVSEGIAVFVASGDAGSQECNATGPAANYNQLCTSYPGTDPNVVSAGGVTVPLDGAGNLTGPLQAWGLGTNSGLNGTGGGTSLYFAQPAWQIGIPGITGTTRNVPDASAVGDPRTGPALLIDADPSLGGTQLGSIGGTSVAAPELAAMWALVLQACKQTASCANGPSAHPYRLGNPAPLLYKIYAGKGGLPYANVFYDVIYGSNAQVSTCLSGQQSPCPSPSPSPLGPGYNAGPGYDQTTGLGVPYARNLIKAIVGV